MKTEQTHHNGRTKINRGIGEVTLKIPDRVQRHDKISPSQVSAENPGQIRLTHQCLIDLEADTRATIYPPTRNSQLPTMVTSQT